MTHYIFRSKLLMSIKDMLHTNCCEMARRIGTDVCSRSTLSRSFESGDTRFVILVHLLNAYRMDIRSFFATASTIADATSNVMIPERDFVPYEFDPSLLVDLRTKPESITCKGLADYMTTHCVDELPVLCGGKRVSMKEETKHTVSSKDVTSSSFTPNESGDYVFNMMLFASLPSVLGLQRVDIGRGINRSENLYSVVSVKKKILVRTLVAICNRFHIDIMHFFTKREYLPMDITVPQEEWHDISFHPERIINLCEEREQGKMVKLLGYSRTRFYRVINPEKSPLLSNHLIDILNKLDLDPSFFFDNAGNCGTNKVVAYHLNNKISSQQDKIEQLSTEKRLLESRLRHAEAVIKLNEK